MPLSSCPAFCGCRDSVIPITMSMFPKPGLPFPNMQVFRNRITKMWWFFLSTLSFLNPQVNTASSFASSKDSCNLIGSRPLWENPHVAQPLSAQRNLDNPSLWRGPRWLTAGLTDLLPTGTPQFACREHIPGRADYLKHSGCKGKTISCVRV